MSLDIFHLRGPWKGQQGLPKPVVFPFPWVNGRLSHTKRRDVLDKTNSCSPHVGYLVLGAAPPSRGGTDVCSPKDTSFTFVLAASQSKLFSTLYVSSSLFRVTLHHLTPLFADFSYSSTTCQGIIIIKKLNFSHS